MLEKTNRVQTNFEINIKLEDVMKHFFKKLLPYVSL